MRSRIYSDMDRRIALITGANRGLGFETCRRLAKLGHRVIVTSRTLDRAKTAAAQLSEENLDVVPLEMNVADEASPTGGFFHDRKPVAW
jgi:NAD(P)-dependent dehydrogenase (short-subunit alcohol dehydrogenase family)